MTLRQLEHRFSSSIVLHGIVRAYWYDTRGNMRATKTTNTTAYDRIMADHKLPRKARGNYGYTLRQAYEALYRSYPEMY